MAGYGSGDDTNMSYILDALKKLEHEKARKTRGGVVNIAGDLLENERPRAVGLSLWKIVLAVSIAILVTFAVTWKFFSSGGTAPAVIPDRREAGKSATSPVKSEVIVQQPAPPAVSTPVVTAPDTPHVVTTPSRPVPVSVPLSHRKRQRSDTDAEQDEEDTASVLTQQELSRRLNERKGASGTVLPGMAPPADIKLSGIAYQDERRARRAVVNGFLMREGSVVSGATITDIQQDRVRFVLAGRTFELTLVSTDAASGK